MTVKSILDTDILSEYLKGHNVSVAAKTGINLTIENWR